MFLLDLVEYIFGDNNWGVLIQVTPFIMLIVVGLASFLVFWTSFGHFAKWFLGSLLTAFLTLAIFAIPDGNPYLMVNWLYTSWMWLLLYLYVWSCFTVIRDEREKNSRKAGEKNASMHL